MVENRRDRAWSRIAGVAMAAVLISTLVVLAGAAGWDAHARPRLTAVETALQATATQVVLRLDRRVRFKVFTLPNPPRVVIDLDELRWGPPSRSLEVGTGLVKTIRYGVFRPGTSRIVLDCVGPVRIAAARLLDGTGDGQFRLVVDVAPRSPEARQPTTAPPARSSRDREADRLAAMPPAIAMLARARPAPKPDPPYRPIVVIDPGHGGADPGAISVSGQYEKRITLTAARVLRRALQDRGGYRVMLTRDRDVFISLRTRIAIARAAGADVFLSLHADANPVKALRGASVYTLSEQASDAEAAALAERENKADLIAGLDLTTESPEVTNILIDLAQRESMNRSAQLANRLVRALGEETRLLRNTHRFAGFAVLKAPDVPSVLIELGLLSNPDDDRLLGRRDHLDALAAAMVRALDSYFDALQVASADG